jgi:alkanesulfonate monooxygenase SsuD/methylene tetrahydromethanopterin reductase-like flavin-dependent oxidoreductase (luciferase family)
MKVSLTLPNRGVLFGVTSTAEMLDMAEAADQSGLFRSVWVGDSLLGKPRVESIVLLAAIAARTRDVKIGTACMASFTLRDPVLLAYQWASLDLIAGGRSILVACTGLVEQEGARVEAALYGLEPKQRVRRLLEWIKILRLLWTHDDVSFEGEEYRFQGVTIEPKPAAKPTPPIWIANNARGDRALIERTHRRCARHADGWQTSIWDPEDLRWRIEDTRLKLSEEGRDPDSFDVCLYQNININEDRQVGLVESKRFLETYYVPRTFSDQDICDWCALGSPEECVEKLRAFEAMGATEVALRITSWDQAGQYRRLVEEVLPAYLGSAASLSRHSSSPL